MWMTLKEAAKYLRISKETLYKMAQQKHMPAAKVGRQWRFKKQTIDSWIETNEQSDSKTNPEAQAGELA